MANMFIKNNSLQDVLPELESLRARLGEAKGALDKEHLKSADLENKCTQLEEELKFKMSLLEKELVEVFQDKEGLAGVKYKCRTCGLIKINFNRKQLGICRHKFLALLVKCC